MKAFQFDKSLRLHFLANNLPGLGPNNWTGQKTGRSVADKKSCHDMDRLDEALNK